VAVTDLEVYEASTLDWDAINALAVRADAETPLKQAPALGYVSRQTNEYVEVLGPHWLLNLAFTRFEELRGHIVEEGCEQIFYVLIRDGKLMKISITEEIQAHRDGHWLTYKDKHSASTFNEYDVVAFDFAKVHFDQEDMHSPNGRAWGERSGWLGQAGALLETRRGAGLLQLLENLRVGEAAQAEGPEAPRQTSPSNRTLVLPGLTKFHHTPDTRAKLIRSLESQRDEVAAAERSFRIWVIDRRLRKLRRKVNRLTPKLQKARARNPNSNKTKQLQERVNWFLGVARRCEKEREKLMEHRLRTSRRRRESSP